MSYVFSPEIVESMAQALEQVCRELTACGHSNFSRELIASRIVAHAGKGVTDPACLADSILHPQLLVQLSDATLKKRLPSAAA